MYLTPLERKAVKESVPFPSPSPPPASPPTQKNMSKKKAKSKAIGREATQPKKTEKKLTVHPFSTVAKTIKLSKVSTRFVLLS